MEDDSVGSKELRRWSWRLPDSYYSLGAVSDTEDLGTEDGWRWWTESIHKTVLRKDGALRWANQECN